MPTDRQFRRFVAETEGKITALVDQLAAGRITAGEFGGRMLTTLADAHALAGYHGRVRAGDTAPFDQDDAQFGRLVAHEEQEHLWGFESDLAAGRYTDAPGGFDRAAVERRALLYTDRLTATANEALILVDGAAWNWVNTETSCQFCERRAAGSPYAAGTVLPAPHPGCRCRIETTGGLAGFAASF